MKKVLLLLLFNIVIFASIAQVQAIRGDAKAIRNGQSISLKLGSKIEQNDTIKTSKKAKLQLRFNDRTIITIGKNSNISMKDYNYDKKKPANNRANFGIKNGLFKVVTGKIGKMNPQKFKLKTKTATMGIRGTELTIKDAGDQGTVVGCTSGAITVASNTTGAEVDIPAGQMTDVKPGADPSPARAYNPQEMGGADEGLSDESSETEESTEESEESEESTEEDEGTKEEESEESSEESGEKQDDEAKESEEDQPDESGDKEEEPVEEGEPTDEANDEQGEDQDKKGDNSDGNASTGEGEESAADETTKESATEETKPQNEEVVATEEETPTEQEPQAELTQEQAPEETPTESVEIAQEDSIEQPVIDTESDVVVDDVVMSDSIEFDEESLNAQVDVVDTTAIEQTTTQITESVESSIDTTPPSSPTVSISNIKEIDGSDYLASTSLALSGESEAGSDVIVTIGETTYTTTADSDGKWSLDITLSQDGEYTVSTYAQDSANNISSNIEQTFTVDTTAPTATITDSTTFDTQTPTISGSVNDTNATVTVTINGTEYTPTVGSDGSWSVTSSELSDGDYTVSVTATDQLGNESSAVEDSFEVATNLDFTGSPLTPSSVDTSDYTQVFGSTTTNESGKTQLQYMEFGYWDQDGDLATVDDTFPFLNGSATPESIVQGYIDNANTATYTGGFRALVEDSSIDSGSISLNVDFGSSDVTGSINFDTATTYDATINSGSVSASGISSSDITGTSVTDGTLQGQFYGDSATEVGGIFELNSSGGSAQGVYGASGTISGGN
jgi:hypothetical protein